MDHTLKLIDKTTLEFSKKVLAPARLEHDTCPPPATFIDVIKKAYDMDLFHVIQPESLGGMGLNMRALCTVLTNICEEDTSLGGIIFTHTTAQELLLASGATHLLAPKNSQPLENVLIAFQIYDNPFEIEPIAKATQEDDTYIISGLVKYLVLGHFCKYAIIPANINNNEVAFFLIDLTEKSVQSSPPILSLGLHACGAVDIELKHTRAKLLGSEKKGKHYYNTMITKMSLAAAAMSLGIMKGSLKEAINYAKNRSQGGKKIIDWSELKMILANMAIQVKTSDMLIDRACQSIDNKHKQYGTFVHAATLSVQTSACQLTSDGIQVLGGVGYMKDFGQEKRFRDAHHIQSIFGMVPLKKLQYIDLCLNIN